MTASLCFRRFLLHLLTFATFASAAPFFSSVVTRSPNAHSHSIPPSYSIDSPGATNDDSILGKRQFATFGPHLSMGQTDSEYIKLTTTFVPGAPPAQMTGSLFIWPGFFDQKNRSEGDLVQTVAEFHDAKGMKETCAAGPGQW
jgi:hypothetical protein